MQTTTRPLSEPMARVHARLQRAAQNPGSPVVRTFQMSHREVASARALVRRGLAIEVTHDVHGEQMTAGWRLAPVGDPDTACAQCGGPRSSARHAGYDEGHPFVEPADEPATAIDRYNQRLAESNAERSAERRPAEPARDDIPAPNATVDRGMSDPSGTGYTIPAGSRVHVRPLATGYRVHDPRPVPEGATDGFLIDRATLDAAVTLDTVRDRIRRDQLAEWADAADPSGAARDAAIQADEDSRPEPEPEPVDPHKVADVVAYIRADILPTFGLDAFRQDPGGFLDYCQDLDLPHTQPADDVAAAAIAVICGPHPTPSRGMTFVHARGRTARQGVPFADSPRVECRVTKVTPTTVYFRYDLIVGAPAQAHVDRRTFAANTVGAYLR